MQERHGRETRNKQTHPATPTNESHHMVLLSQDPTVCQTLNHPVNPRPTVPEPPGFVLKKTKRPDSRYLLIFHP